MITNIVKRNGTVEEFSPSKINGWGTWAAKKLGNHVDWASVVMDTVNQCPSVCSSLQLQETLIKVCMSRKTWEYNRMAGRLYAALLERIIYPEGRPTVKELHEVLFNDGLMVKLNYSDDEYAEVEKIINHKQDLKYPHYQINQIRFKYALRNKVAKKEYETPQFVYMRMAMALAENEPIGERMTHVQKWYEHFSQNRLNPPTPNFVNLGTKLNGYASCCLYTTDDSAASLAAGDHIAYMMTCMSAGIGTHIKTRSLGDSVRGGLIQHQGKLPYYRAMVGAIGANLQNGRGGASTVYYTAYDPEVEVIQKLRHPMTPITKKIAGCHYNFGSNRTFARKVARNEEFAPFSYYDNPALYYAQYSGDQENFERLYAEHEKTAVTKLNAREVALGALTQAYETGVHYLHFTDVMNYHTPFKDTIFSSNLCAEIGIPTAPFKTVADLYKDEYEEGDGEIGLCSLAGVIVSNITSDEQYAEVAYYALKMIDVCIHKSDYVFKNLEHTAKARLSAGVGVLGLAHLMAKEGQKYDTEEGRNFIHELFETHMWHLINASLKLGKELGNAPWMHKTKWPEGWLPIDTSESRVDTLVTVGNKRDWESLRRQIIANGGIRNSVVSALMPGESCLRYDTKIKTEFGDLDFREIATYGGLNVDEIENDHNKVTGGSWYTLDKPIMVQSTDGMKPVDKLWFNGATTCLEIEMENGEILTATHHHKFLINLPDGSRVWKMAMDLVEGDDIVEIAELGNGKTVGDTATRIKSIRQSEAAVATYDIEVPDVHNYILANGVVTHNSTIAAGTTNGPYPIRELYLMKTNDTGVNHWCAPDSTKLKNKYQSAWDISTSDMIKAYAIMQKWTDQAISADLFVKLQGDAKVSSTSIINDYLDMVRYGMKTRYYVNSLTSSGVDLEKKEVAIDLGNDDQPEGSCENCSL